MSFFIAAILGAFSFVLYLAGERQAFTSVCGYTFDLCQHPSWPLYLAAALVGLGMLFRLQRM
jgi:MYXO-CTERM domain-containing protein